MAKIKITLSPYFHRLFLFFNLASSDDMKLYCGAYRRWLHKQRSLTLFADWCSRNKLISNVENCQVMFDYHISGNVPDSVTDSSGYQDDFWSASIRDWFKRDSTVGLHFQSSQRFLGQRCAKIEMTRNASLDKCTTTLENPLWIFQAFFLYSECLRNWNKSCFS